MNLTNLLLNAMTDDASVRALEEKSGASNKQIKLLLLLAVPLLIKYLTSNASSSSGASSLLGALSQHTNTDPLANQLQNANQTDGAAIIQHILGGSTNSAVSNLTNQTGMNSQQVSTVLNCLAPALLSGLSQAASSASSAGSDTLHLVGGGNQSSSSGSGLGSLFGSLTGGSSSAAPSGGLDILGSLLGGGSQQSAPASSGLGSLLGLGSQASSGLGSLLGLGSQASSGLGSLLGGASSSSFDGTDLMNILLGGK